MREDGKKITLIVSAYNEEAGLRLFYEEAVRVLKTLESRFVYELLFVNDGSTDRTGEILTQLQEQDPAHVGRIDFSRNFGHEAAMTAGLDYAQGDYLVFMDSDLQNPPACLPEILEKLEQGFDIVSMVRESNETAGRLKNITSNGFYKVINILSEQKLQPSVSDFFAMSSRAAEVLRKSYRDKVRFLRGYVQNIGFKKTAITYTSSPRAAGESHYSLKKLFKFAMDVIVCHSQLPLKAGLAAGILSALAAVVLLVCRLQRDSGAAGAGELTILTVLCLLFSVLFFITGILGSYLGLAIREMKDRPVYIVMNRKPAQGESENP